MSNYTQKILEIYKQIEETANEHNKTLLEVKKDLDVVFTDKFTLQISKEYKAIGVASVIYKKYGISRKYFLKLLNRVYRVVPKKQRKVKEFIYTTLENYDITYNEYIKIAQYFDKHELDTEKALKKLLQLRTQKKKTVAKKRKKTAK